MIYGNIGICGKWMRSVYMEKTVINKVYQEHCDRKLSTLIQKKDQGMFKTSWSYSRKPILMIHWFINSLYECCFGKKKRVKFMIVDKVEELSQHEIEQLRKFLLKPLRCC